MLFELKELLVEVQSFPKPLLAFGNKLSLGMSQNLFEMLSHQSGGNQSRPRIHTNALLNREWTRMDVNKALLARVVIGAPWQYRD
jgi:hypothetical protein